VARKIRRSDHILEVHIDESMHSIHWQQRIIVLASLVKVRSLGYACVCEDKVESLVLLEDGFEDAADRGFVGDIAIMACGVNGGGCAGRTEVKDVDRSVWTFGQCGCDSEIHAGC
jgi:hypothetical protein